MSNELLGRLIRKTHDHEPWDQSWSKTPRTQRDAGMPVEPLPDRLHFGDSEPLHPHIDRHVFVVAVIALVVMLFVTN